MAGQLAGGLEVERPVVVQLVELGGGDVELGHAGVAAVGVADRLGAVLLGVEPDRGRLDPQRQVLRDQGDGAALVGEVARHGQDPGVVVAEAEAGRQRVGVGVVELDPDRAALLADRDRLVEATVDDPQLVEHAQRRAGEEAQLRVVPLALQLGDHDHREDDLVLVEPLQRPRVGQQDAGVEHEGAIGCGMGVERGALGLLGRGRHEVTPHGTARALLARSLVHADGPGRHPKAGVPAPVHAAAGPPAYGAVVNPHERASQYGELPHSPILGKYAAVPDPHRATRPNVG